MRTWRHRESHGWIKGRGRHRDPEAPVTWLPPVSVSSAGVPAYVTIAAGAVVAGLITTVSPSTTAETFKTDLVAPNTEVAETDVWSAASGTAFGTNSGGTVMANPATTPGAGALREGIDLPRGPEVAFAQMYGNHGSNPKHLAHGRGFVRSTPTGPLKAGSEAHRRGHGGDAVLVQDARGVWEVHRTVPQTSATLGPSGDQARDGDRTVVPEPFRVDRPAPGNNTVPVVEPVQPGMVPAEIPQPETGGSEMIVAATPEELLEVVPYSVVFPGNFAYIEGPDVDDDYYTSVPTVPVPPTAPEVGTGDLFPEPGSFVHTGPPGQLYEGSNPSPATDLGIAEPALEVSDVPDTQAGTEVQSAPMVTPSP